ncbi:MAG: hypothetical protein US42_C0007G0038 [Candidatus Magasanikbacteria bacterium GW2011_GWC2_37_14]|uniref:Uncharacterized protein n=1 Tax=Candidatus Magasanikbacteria bacterium GW2011_GWC2_37_14 TaxID=1619046 RepID=A0A0G0GCG5_9BACT|nr:MAG: hypothetical protein US42_C0007G0038 [Candidatus Magasanikbacteria bacterium GW2011_GWC2_37_14]
MQARITCRHGKCRQTVVFEDSDFSEHYKNPEGIQGGSWVRVYKKACHNGHPNFHEVEEKDEPVLARLRSELKSKQEELARLARQKAGVMGQAPAVQVKPPLVGLRFVDEVPEDDDTAQVLRASLFTALPGGKKPKPSKKGIKSTPPSRSFKAKSANKSSFVRVVR